MNAPQITKLRVMFTFYVRHNDDLTDADVESFIERAFLSQGTRSTDKPYLVSWYYVPEASDA